VTLGILARLGWPSPGSLMGQIAREARPLGGGRSGAMIPMPSDARRNFALPIRYGVAAPGLRRHPIIARSPEKRASMRTEQLAQLRAKAQTKPRRILVVEDEEDIRDLLCELLSSGLENVIVEGRPDGPAALRAIAASPPDLIITDFKMPGMTGLDFLAHVRLQLPHVPAILITAFPDLELAVRAINEARVQSFLQKPVDPSQVLRVVGGILSAFGQRSVETSGIRPAETQRLQRLG